MPIGNGDDCGGCGWGPADVVPAKEIIETISAQAQSIGLGKPAARHCHAPMDGVRRNIIAFPALKEPSA